MNHSRLAPAPAAVARWLRAQGGALLCVLALAWVYGVLVRRLNAVPIAFDESYFLWTGWSLNHGMVPYRQFIEYKPVTVFFFNALSLKIFGLAYHRFRYLSVILTASSFLGLAGSLFRRGTDRVLVFAVVCSIELTVLIPGLHDSGLNDTETLGISFFLLGVAGLLWGGRRIHLSNGLGGAFLALAVLSKEPFAFIVVTAWITLGYWGRQELGTPWRQYAKSTILGATTVVGLVMTYLVVTRAIPYYASVMREYFGYCARIGCSQPKHLGQLITTAWGHVSPSLLTADLLGGLVPFFVAFAIAGPGLASRLGVVATVIASFHAISLGGCYFRHYFIMGLAGLFLWACLGAIALTRAQATASRSLSAWIRWAIVAALFVQYGPRLNVELAAKYSSPAVDLMGTPAALVEFVKKNTAPTDYVFSDGPPGIFLTTDRLRPTREGAFLDEFIDSYPGKTDTEKLSAVRAQLVARKPKVVYLDPSYVSRKRRTRAALIMPFLHDLGYRPVLDNVYFRP